MSTTTVMELTDTQMLDYSTDGDYTMHATGHSSEWLSVEATMSDDPILSATEYSETIEVDMEQNEDEEMTEYEMTDGIDYVHESVVEIQDVDFADPSQVVSPLGASAIGSPALAGVPPQPYVELPHLLLSPAVHSESFTYHHNTTLDTPGDHTPDIDALAQPAIHGAAGHSHEPSAHSLASSTAEHTEVGREAPAPERPVSPAGPAPAHPAAHPEPKPQSSSLEHEEERAAGEVASGEAVENTGPEDGSLQTGEAPAEPVRPTDTMIDLATHGEVHESASNSDPHEISDGVYIDPPPTVLLSLLSSSQRLDCCLFNQPPSGSGSQSPNAYASTSTAPALALLLSQRPTLYYEPLNNVLEALRQEAVISGMEELADGELVIEAYDLDLRITEDNIHAGEVTIHELNILHDGIDLTGPLRLRLSAVPRFITRYYALRDQVAQLSIEAGLESGPRLEPVAAEPGKEYEETDHHEALPIQVGASEAEYSEVANQVYNEEGNEAPPAETVEPEDDSTAPNSSGEPSAAQVERPEQLTSDEQEHVEKEASYLAEDPDTEETEDALAEYGTELTAEEAAEGLDSGEVHRRPDAEDGGDYTDYAENPDDEEEFGEALPEDASGAVSEVADSQHELLADPNGEASTNGDAAAVEAEAKTALDAMSPDTTEPPGATAATGGAQPETDGLNDHTSEDAIVGHELANSTSHTESSEFGDFEGYDAEGEDQQNGEPAHPEEEFEDWGEFEDDETELNVNVSEEDGLSKGSSETLSTLSKRSRDEEGDEEEDADGHPPGSPDSKRVRVE